MLIVEIAGNESKGCSVDGIICSNVSASGNIEIKIEPGSESSLPAEGLIVSIKSIGY